MATGLENKATPPPPGGLLTVTTPDWPLYFCNVRGHLGRWVWEDDEVKRKLGPGGKTAGEGVTVVHPDTGYSDHPELFDHSELSVSGRLDVMRSRNFLNRAADAMDPLLGRPPQYFPSHGSATAGLLMSKEGHPNDPHTDPNDPDFDTREFRTYLVAADRYVTGIAPKAKLIPCLVTTSVILSDLIFGDSVSALTGAIYYAIDLSKTDSSVGVVSISLGCEVRPKRLAKAIEIAKSNGIVVCAAAGQLHKTLFKGLGPGYPGRDANAICVAACDWKHAMLDTGLYGPEVDVTAPGVGIWRSLSTRPPGGGDIDFTVEQSDGSSYGTALVAGACALWQAHHGRAKLIADYGAERIFDLFRWALAETCDTRGGTWDTKNHGMGVLDVETLLKKELIGVFELDDWTKNH